MYNTAENMEDLDMVDELLSYDSVLGVEEHHQILDDDHKDADFVICVRDFSEFEAIESLLTQSGYTAYVTDYESEEIKIN